MDLYYLEGSCFSRKNVEGIGLIFAIYTCTDIKYVENSYFYVIGRKIDKRKEKEIRATEFFVNL